MRDYVDTLAASANVSLTTSDLSDIADYSGVLTSWVGTNDEMIHVVNRHRLTVRVSVALLVFGAAQVACRRRFLEHYICAPRKKNRRADKRYA